MKYIKIIAKCLLLLCLLVSAVFGVLWLLNAPADLQENSQSKARLEHNGFTVQTLDIEITDDSRSTPALGEFKGANKRTLIGTVWFPKGNSQDHPLIVFSHGFGSFHKGCKHIAEYLVRNGYVVAAVDFPLSNRKSPAGLPQILDVANQPGDVSVVIDHVLGLNENPNSQLHKRIDAKQIGAYGLSLGGLTTALASFHPDFKDERIKASVMMAPPLEMFSADFYATNPAIETLILSGSKDRVVPETANAIDVRPRHKNGWFMSFDNGSHLGFANIGNPIRWMNNPDDLGCKFMDMTLDKLDLPERWDAVVPNSDGVLRDVTTGEPCPNIDGKAMNGLKQQWLTRLAIGAFFDMHLKTDDAANQARRFFTKGLSQENPAVKLTMPAN